jgi:hypothetical protein
VRWTQARVQQLLQQDVFDTRGRGPLGIHFEVCDRLVAKGYSVLFVQVRDTRRTAASVYNTTNRYNNFVLSEEDYKKKEEEKRRRRSQPK